MPGKLLHPAHPHRLAPCRRRPAHAPPPPDRLARHLALEGAEDEFEFPLRLSLALDVPVVVPHVEAGPVDAGEGGGGEWETVVEVPEEGGGVGEGGDPVALAGGEEGEQGGVQLGIGGGFAEGGGEVGGVGVYLGWGLMVELGERGEVRWGWEWEGTYHDR